MKNNRPVYCIIIVIGVISVYFTKQWLVSQKQNAAVVETAPEPYVFDPSTYVDPYGITTCYPSDRERIRKQKAQKASQSSTKGKYHYRITVNNVSRDWDTYEHETTANGDVRMKKKSSDLSYINSTYEWDMDLCINNQDELLSYIINNYDWLKKYKISNKASNIYDEYNDRFDEYRDDPEDESTFDPDVFYFLDD